MIPLEPAVNCHCRILAGVQNLKQLLFHLVANEKNHCQPEHSLAKSRRTKRREKVRGVIFLCILELAWICCCPGALALLTELEVLLPGGVAYCEGFRFSFAVETLSWKCLCVLELLAFFRTSHPFEGMFAKPTSAE